MWVLPLGAKCRARGSWRCVCLQNPKGSGRGLRGDVHQHLSLCRTASAAIFRSRMRAVGC